MSALKALGITSHIYLEKIRKVVAKRTFEARDLMLRSYYAVKFSPSSQVDFSRQLVCSSALYSASRICEKYSRSPYSSTNQNAVPSPLNAAALNYVQSTLACASGHRVRESRG
jgi:hypothetical protein